jgi:hypothetical protein
LSVLLSDLRHQPQDRKLYETIVRLLKAAETHRLPLNLWAAQNYFFDMIQIRLPGDWSELADLLSVRRPGV